jgi:hypothetical protein
VPESSASTKISLTAKMRAKSGELEAVNLTEKTSEIVKII